jgi:CMP-N,N'-diacetyllegionaminic acid synthase
LEVLALIPARSGSKSITDKNIRPLGGKPLMAWSIAHALSARTVTRTIVSTDSTEYAAIARQFRAEAPFLRPPEISGDMATDLETFRHALGWLEEHEGFRPDICVHLRPTHPVRNPADIDRMVEILRDNPGLDSVRSVVPAPETPFKMWFRGADGLLSPVIQTEIREAYNQPRQALPPTYLQNASIDVVRARVIREQRSMNGQHIHGYVMDAIYDIDDEAQLERAARQLSVVSGNRPTSASPKTFVFDIDGVVATIVPNLDYELAGPNHEMIRVINFLHDQGHRIVLFTARGSKTGRDWQETTRRQMAEWGVKYDALAFGKPAADYYVDDKAMHVQDALTLAKSWGMPG